MIDKALLEILVCPACKTGVHLEGEWLVCKRLECGLKYPIRDDIPVMLVEEAQKPGEAANSKDQGGGRSIRRSG